MSGKGFPAICNPKCKGALNKTRFINAWKARVRCRGKKDAKDMCIPCSLCAIYDITNYIYSRNGDLKRAAIRDPTLLNVAASSKVVKETYITVLWRRSNVDKSVAEGLLTHPAQYYFCYYHFNPSRYWSESRIRTPTRVPVSPQKIHVLSEEMGVLILVVDCGFSLYPLSKRRTWDLPRG